MDEPEIAKATTDPDDPHEVLLSLEGLPPELQPTAAEPSEAEPVGEGAPATEPGSAAARAAVEDTARPARTVPTQALREERGRRKAETARANAAEQKVSTYEAAERARANYLAARARTESPDAPAKPVRPTKGYGDAPDLDTAFNRLGEHTDKTVEYLERVIDQRTAVLQAEVLSERIQRTEAEIRRQVDDYDEVLEKSGVRAAIIRDPITKQAPDPFLNELILSQPDPARAAYDYAKGKLEGRQPATEPTARSAREPETDAVARAHREGRREVVTQLRAAADRPRGISRLSGVGEPASPGLTRGQIAAMSEEQQRLIKTRYPHVWDRYLGKPA